MKAYADWKDTMKDILDGVERELCPSTPIKTRADLTAFRMCLDESPMVRRRKQFEQELEAFLQSKPFLRAAGKRYLRKKLIPALEMVTAVMNEVARVLAQDKTRRQT